MHPEHNSLKKKLKKIVLKTTTTKTSARFQKVNSRKPSLGQLKHLNLDKLLQDLLLSFVTYDNTMVIIHILKYACKLQRSLKYLWSKQKDV
jgi:hypothetical protein